MFFFVLIFSISYPILLLSLGIYGSFLFTFSIPIFWQIGIRKESFFSLGIKRKYLFPSVIIGLVSGIALGLLGVFILKFLGIKGSPLTGEESIFGFSFKGELGYHLLTKNKFLFLFYCIFLAGFGEELFWRGFIQQKMKNYFKKRFSIWFTALLFSLFHFYFLLISTFGIATLLFISVVFLGALWGYLFERSENIFLPAISHGILAFIIWRYYFL